MHEFGWNLNHPAQSPRQIVNLTALPCDQIYRNPCNPLGSRRICCTPGIISRNILHGDNIIREVHAQTTSQQINSNINYAKTLKFYWKLPTSLISAQENRTLFYSEIIMKRNLKNISSISFINFSYFKTLSQDSLIKIFWLKGT